MRPQSCPRVGPELLEKKVLTDIPSYRDARRKGEKNWPRRHAVESMSMPPLPKIDLCCVDAAVDEEKVFVVAVMRFDFFF